MKAGRAKISARIGLRCFLGSIAPDLSCFVAPIWANFSKTLPLYIRIDRRLRRLHETAQIRRVRALRRSRAIGAPSSSPYPVSLFDAQPH
jgi:hypothetical protein